jgi:hypothetical protein
MFQPSHVLACTTGSSDSTAKAKKDREICLSEARAPATSLAKTWWKYRSAMNSPTPQEEQMFHSLDGVTELGAMPMVVQQKALILEVLGPMMPAHIPYAPE